MTTEPIQGQISRDDSRIVKAVEYFNVYNSTLRQLLTGLPAESRENLFKVPNPHLATGPIKIILCTNGVVAAILNGFALPEDYIDLSEAPRMTMINYLNSVSEEFTRFVDPISKLTWPGYRWPHFQDGSSYDKMIFQIIVGNPGGLPRFPAASKLFLMGFECFENADHRLKAEEAAAKSLADARGLVNLHSVSAASKLLKSYRELLDRDTSEAELQTFLEAHPELIYPEYEIVRPQPSLGGERQPDFAFSMRSAFGARWIFVEIERPNKPIFTKGPEFQFAYEFTQAKGQLLQWDHLITRDHAYIRDRFEGLVKPEFHLIYGRDAELDRNRRGMLGAEFSAASNRMFSTFDDLANRFETIANRVFAAKI